MQSRIDEELIREFYSYGYVLVPRDRIKKLEFIIFRDIYLTENSPDFCSYQESLILTALSQEIAKKLIEHKKVIKRIIRRIDEKQPGLKQIISQIEVIIPYAPS